MATLLEDIEAALASCVPVGGAWPLVNTNEPPLIDGSGQYAPFIVFQRVVSTDNVSLQGPSDVQNTLLQVDIFAPTLSAAETVRVATDAALLALAPTTRCVPKSSQDLYEAPASLYRILRQYSLWR